MGEKWFGWLQSEGVDFAIRVKKNIRVSNGRGCFVQAQDLFRTLKPDETLVLAGARTVVTGTAVYLSALRLDDGGLPVVATAKPCLDTIEAYALRWQIETLFGCLKSRGFNFEGTHVTDRRRICPQGTRNACWWSR